jgi:ubiquinone/menaquinone biosynthesis C-methylase UbiE
MTGLPPEILDHYDRYDERARLTDALGRLEWDRTLEILARVLPPPPARVLDVGGGPGRYSHHLTMLGYEVHLIDPVPKHVAQAREGPLASAELGDALSLDHDDTTFDAVLLLGPLYHLPDDADRLRALLEAHRVLLPGGRVAVAAISRFAPAIDGLDRGFFEDATFREILAGDLRDGRHHNRSGRLEHFTTAYFHQPEELEAEMLQAGFRAVEVLGVEGIGWADRDLENRRHDPDRWDLLMDLLRQLEGEQSLLGASPHLLGVGRRQPMVA